MATCVKNICAKNRYNPLIVLKVTIDNVGVPFLRHSVQPQTQKQHRFGTFVSHLPGAMISSSQKFM